jgi:acetolactate decarboxylase
MLDETFIKAFMAHRGRGDLFHDGAHEAHEVFQTSTISALLERVYDGQTTIGELASHGDFGLGTFNALDGEMTALDGVFYQCKSDGRAYVAEPTACSPFAVVMRFDPTVAISVDEPMDFAVFAHALDAAVPSRNIFYAIKADGVFDHIRVRAVPRQDKPYPAMSDVVRDQPVFDHHDIEGTMVGFRFPDYTVGLNAPGYHLHFISADRGVGGHVLAFEMRRAHVDVDITSDFHMELPEAGAFLDADLAKDNAASIEKIEK